MPPHSENVNEFPCVDIEDGVRRRQKRSRSTSPFFLRRSPRRERNTLTQSGSNSSLSSSRSSRSSSVISEFRVPLGASEFVTIKARSSADKHYQVATLGAKCIVNFHEAPEFLQFNPFIVRGYRTNLCRITCLKR